MIPDDRDLKQDLAGPIYWFDSAGRKQLEPKDDIKKRGLPSPDLADALALTFSHPVMPKARNALPGRAFNKDRRTYDPYQHAT